MNNVDKWGRDHWSQLLYVETVCVDGNGRLDPLRMRNKKRSKVHGLGGWDPKYGTRMRDGSVLGDHDDFDVMDDLGAAGLVEPWVPNAGVRRRVVLTETGAALAAQLRRHRSLGGSTSNFVPEGVSCVE